MILCAVALGLTAALALWRLADARREARIWARLAAPGHIGAGPARFDPARFDPDDLRHLPPGARRYLTATIAPGTPLYTNAVVEMGGRIGLGPPDAPGYAPGYRAMRARQIIALPQGFIWQVRLGAMAGSDGFAHGRSWTRFRILDLVPVVRAGGADHAKSAFGRLVAEAAFWTPTALLTCPGLEWTDAGPETARFTVTAHGFRQTVDIALNPAGRATRVELDRWSNENAARKWRWQSFGGDLSAHRDIAGVTVPMRVDAGNHYGTPGYVPFFRARVTHLMFGPT